MARVRPTHDSRFLEQLRARLLDRRQVLLGLGATGAALSLPSCHKSKAKLPVPDAGMPTTFDTIHSVRELLRTSPDHLAARAAQIIASKDFTSAVRFVRDQIAVLPPPRATDAATDGVRWGADGALRAGAGTQRERAELLKAMLLAMGTTATVRYADLPAGLDAAALYRARPTPFAIDLTKLQAFDSKTAATLAHINDAFPDADPSALVSSLLALIPAAQAMVAQPFDGLDTRVPVVEYAAGGATRWAFALGTVDEVTSSPSGLGSELPPPAYPTVSARLLAAMGTVPGVASPAGLVELCAGTWTADQLAGTRLSIVMSSPTPAASAGAPGSSVPVRITTMRVHRSTALEGAGDPALWSASKGAAAPAEFLGAPFSVSGSSFTAPAQPGDPLGGPYGALTPAGSNHAAALASVASLQVVANARAFPNVQLTVAALDAGGQPVDGLVGSDFALTDETKAQAPALLSNAGVQQLKVMLAYDCSGSVVWNTPADKMAFDEALANAMVNSAATEPFLLGVAPLGASVNGGYTAPNTGTIASDISSCAGFSEIWSTLGQLAPHDGASAVVIASDMQSSDDPAMIPALKKLAAVSGLAVALVPISNTVDQNTIAAVENVCGATVLDPTATDFQQKLTDFISGVTAQAKRSSYRFAYRLPDDQQANQGMRTAQVALATRASVSGSAQYQVPALDARGSAGVAGLYLELSDGMGNTVTRHLSGPQLDRFGNPIAATPADYAATLSLLDGNISVAFEPGSPTSGQSADDLLSAILSGQALPSLDGQSLSDVAKKVQLKPYHATQAAMVAPPATAGSVPSAPLGLRVLVTTQAATSTSIAYRTDLVPELNRSVGASKDASAAFQEALRVGVGLALRESLVMPQSAAGALSGKPLQYLAPSGDPATLSGFSADDLTNWRQLFDEYGDSHLLVPTDPTVGAAWVIHPATGSTMAVSLDGSGGGSCLGMAANLYIQTALSILQACIADHLLQCESGVATFNCDGANSASVAATVVGLYAGLIFDATSMADFFLGMASIIPMSPANGLRFSVLMVMIALCENGLGTLEAC